MTNKYTVESNIDFYKQLHEISDDDSDSGGDTKSDSKNMCLITGNSLCDKSVTLQCGHKFNYDVLSSFLMIIKHKSSKFSVKADQHKSDSQLVCPYCRQVHEGLLKFYPELKIPRTIGVNFYTTDPPQYIGVSKLAGLTFVPTTDCLETTNNRCEYYTNQVSDKCSAEYHYKILSSHKARSCFGYATEMHIDDMDRYNDHHKYCAHHKMNVIKKYDKIFVNKLVRMEKRLNAQQKKENVSKESKASVTRCDKILIQGLRKGGVCGNPVFNKCTHLCKRHFNALKPSNNQSLGISI